MIESKLFLIAEYAHNNNGSLTIAGTMDVIEVSRPPGVTPEQVRDIRIPRLFVVFVTEASLIDGLEHRVQVRLVNGSGISLVEPFTLDQVYILNDLGRPMRYNGVLQFNDVVFPSPDDYEFELWLMTDPPRRLSVTPISVVDRTPAHG